MAEPKEVDPNNLQDKELATALDSAKPERASDAPQEHNLDDLLKLDTHNDPNCLLGERADGITSRWLCRGGSVVYTGVSGAGKSSLLAQQVCTWAIDQSFFGITSPFGPLKSMIIQAENDSGDLSEAFKGVINHVPGIKEHQDKLAPMVRILSGAQGRGDKFRAWITPDILEFKPDLLWIDPLLAYAMDVLDQAEISKFLRDTLDPLAKEFNLGLMVFHHTGKPPKDKAGAHAGWTASDYAYMGLGSSEITNWARAVMYIHRREERKYRLIGAKRGSRANLNGTNADGVDIKWGEHGIYWELDEPTGDKKNESEYETVYGSMLRILSDGGTWTKKELVTKIGEQTGRDAAIAAFGAFERKWLRDWHPIVSGEFKICDKIKATKEGKSYSFNLIK